MIRRVVDLARELAGVPWHPRPQQETTVGIVLAFLGIPCEFGRDCAYPGLGWRCGHLRSDRGGSR
jgi:hypothetical protein